MGFQRSVSDSKFFQIPRTLLSIEAVLNKAVVWMASIYLLSSLSSSIFLQFFQGCFKQTSYNCFHRQPHVAQFLPFDLFNFRFLAMSKYVCMFLLTFFRSMIRRMVPVV